MAFLRIWSLVTLVLIALFMGLEFAHALELPAKMQYDGSLYVTIQNSLYRYFGAPGPGAFVTVGAVLAAISLTVLLRKQRTAFKWAMGGLLCLLMAFPVIFFLWIEPVNTVIEQSTPATLPANWEQLRHQWEFAHFANFVFTLVGFGAFVMALTSGVQQVQKSEHLAEL